MSTSTSDVAEVVRDLGQRLDDRVLAELLDHALLVRVLVRRRDFERVVEEVVALVERRVSAACAGPGGRDRC